MFIHHDLTANDLYGPHCVFRPPHVGSVGKPTHCNHLNEKTPKRLLYFNTTFPSVIEGSCGIFRGWSLDGGSPSLGLAWPLFLCLPLCFLCVHEMGSLLSECHAFPAGGLCRSWSCMLKQNQTKTKRNPFPLICSFVMECFHSYCYSHLHYILVQSC